MVKGPAAALAGCMQGIRKGKTAAAQRASVEQEVRAADGVLLDAQPGGAVVRGHDHRVAARLRRDGLGDAVRRGVHAVDLVTGSTLLKCAKRGAGAADALRLCKSWGVAAWCGARTWYMCL